MPKLKPDDDVVDLAFKYRACCGCMHIQTAAILCCIIALIAYSIDAKNYITGKENNYWEVANIILKYMVAIGPLIENKTYPILPILILFAAMIFSIGVWDFYIVHKCYKYISELQDEQQQLAKERGKRKNGRMHTPNERKSLLNKSPTIKQHVTGYVSSIMPSISIGEIGIFDIFYKSYEYFTSEYRQHPSNLKTPKKQKLSDINSPTKYYCFFGYLHVQTVTTIACILVLLYNVWSLKSYIFESKEFDLWETAKIIYGFIAVAGPLYGIYKSNSKYFFYWFIGPVYRIYWCSLVFLPLFFADLFPRTDFGRKMNDIFEDYDSTDVEKYIKILSIRTLLKLAALFAIILEAWISYNVYKCSKYISTLSLQSYKKPIKIEKSRNENLIKSNDKNSLIELSPSLKQRMVGYGGFAISTIKTAPAKLVENEAISISKRSPELISQWKTLTVTENSELMEWDLEYELKNYRRLQSESTSFIVKSKPREFVEKVIKIRASTEESSKTKIALQLPLSFEKPNASKTRMLEVKQHSSQQSSQNNKASKTKRSVLEEQISLNSGISGIRQEPSLGQSLPTTTSNISKLQTPKETIQQQKNATKTAFKPSKLVECNVKVQLHNHKNTTASETKLAVIMNPAIAVKETINSPLKRNSSKNAAADERYSYYPEDPTPQKLKSIEIQTDGSLLDKETTKKQKNYSLKVYSNTYSSNDKPSSSRNNKYPSGVASSGFSSVSDTDCFSPYENVSPNTEIPSTVVTFLFKDDETSGVEIYQNGRKEQLTNSFDNEWTPLYFSMAESRPAVGEKAQIHLHHFREHVLYDIFKVIGKPMNEIKYDPKWKFKVAEENGVKGFQIRTSDGLRLFPETSILAAFLKSMKLQAEDYLNIEVNKIYLCSNFVLTESQKRIFKDAAFCFLFIQQNKLQYHLRATRRKKGCSNF